MASYTTNYQLHQWEASDDFLRTDFNEDFAKIDAGIKSAADAAAGAASTAAGKARIVTGSYTGNGSSKTVSLGFRPKALWVHGGVYDTMVTQQGGHNMLGLNTTGFIVQFVSGYGDYCANKNGQSYTYAAIQ
ncbi:hypothetical protein [Flavonifractor sp. An10]|uniref:hypothetical protein n=1 Tax=Flavonifractor sp. An10 TaxID=1965537 RepID=UPI000B3A2393|nr:hypothetical protein [Flavonifractor sp. An10]OUQ82727.1 hypothetical protein B5E42_08550 [Flavonifractor sp. An10]